MHARHRSPGGSNSLGFSLEKASRNRGMQNSDYRGFNRGFGRGRPKPYPPRPRRDDIFMEAGRLAAEYLVSQGVLPANCLPEKLQNGNFQEFRSHDRENPPEGGRTSALARLGNVVPDDSRRDMPFSGRKRFGDEFRTRGRRKMGYGRGFGSDWNRDNGRAGPWLEKGRGFPEMMDSEDDSGVGYRQGEKRVGSDVKGRGFPETMDSEDDSGVGYHQGERRVRSDAKGRRFLETMDSEDDSGVGYHQGEKQVGSDVKGRGFPETMDSEDDSRVGYHQGDKRVGSDVKERGFPDMMDSEDDSGVGYHQREKLVGSDVVGGEASRVVDELLPSKSETACDSESDLENFDFPDETGSRKDQTRLDVDLNKGFDPESSVSDVKDDGELRDVVCSEIEIKNVTEDFSSSGGQSVGNDLIRSCWLEKVPTKTRSTLRSRGSKIDPGPINDSVLVLEERIISDVVPAKGLKVSIEEESVEGSSNDSQMHLSHNSSLFASETSRVSSGRPIIEVGEVDPAFDLEREKCTRSQSFSIGSSYLNQQESSSCPPGFGDGVESRLYGRCRSMVQLRDKETFVQNVGLWEGAKRSRDWDSSKISEADECIPLHNLTAHQPSSQVERLSPNNGMVEAVEQDASIDGMEAKSVFSPQVSSYDLEFTEEKQFFPNAFQICYGLPETSERSENTEELVQSHISAQFSTLEVEREAAIGVGLLIGLGQLRYENREALDDVSNGVVDSGVLCSEFQDLFDRFPLLKKLYQSREIAAQLNCLVCLGSKQMIETTYPNLESLLNHTDNSQDLPEVHKCYGLAISQLLGVDLSKFSSEVPNIDDPLGEMRLMNDEGMLGDDDAIYVSLEEIPVNMPEI